MTIVRPAKTAVRLPELEQMAKEARTLESNQVAGKLGFNRQAPGILSRTLKITLPNQLATFDSWHL